MNNENVIGFYDKFVEEQRQRGINDRIYSLYKRLLKQGLRSNSTVLELGCGIGVLTFLLSKKIVSGRIEAVDISPDSINFAKQKLKQSNIQMVAGDIVQHQTSLKNIDFITLFDVLEHIPIERHSELFKNIAAVADEHTQILINIPNPDYIEYDMENQPELLQVIDQPLPLSVIFKNISQNDLVLVNLETYSIWVENDYQFFVIHKKKKFTEIKLSDKRGFIQKAIKKTQRTFVKVFYNYK